MEYAYDLGGYHRSITTSSVEAQAWFDRGLSWIYGFDLEMAGRCFKEAIALDKNCAMAYWGLAYASGIYYNKPWHRMQRDELVQKLKLTYDISREAKARIASVSEVEKMLIEALVLRYQSPEPVDQEHYNRWNDEYADGMRCVYREYSDDSDVAALFAEAMMTRTPWALWDLVSGQPAEGASTLESIEVLDRAIEHIDQTNQKPHPGLLHMYIHVMEMSPFPERALRACDQLRQLVLGSGHLCHMPSHIDVRCGHYYEAIVANDQAIVADRVYLANEGPMNYHTLSRIHNFHLKIYAAMFLGQFHTAMNAVEELVESTPEELLRIENPAMADWMEAYIGIKAHVFIRFGKWQEIIDEDLPVDQTLYAMTTALWRYAKSIAFAATGDVNSAETQRSLFLDAVEKVPETRYMFNNTCLDVLKIAEQMVNGEIEYRKGNYELAYQHLRQAVFLDDNLIYDEPWGWMQPARHALGALLLEQGHVEEAKQVYMDDLGLTDTLPSTSCHPDNLWSLHGLVECLDRQDHIEEARQQRSRLNLAKARADVPINASCACRLEHHCCSE
jgi:tetratricopeptide (TPR) repeat protein